MNHHTPGRTQVRVTEFVLIETGTYNDIYHRPFRAQLTAEVEDQLYRNLNPLRPYTPSHFSGPATAFIKPDATPTGVVNIAGGWENPRMRWVMQLEWITEMGSRLVQVLTGYTDPEAIDLSYGLKVNPDSNFYINNSFIFRVDYINTPNGQIQQLSPFSGGQLLIDPAYNGMMSNNIILARPSDVVQARALNQESTFQHLAGDEYMIDGPSLTNEAKFSARKNSNPSTYISRILEGHRTSYLKNKSYGYTNESIIEDTMTATYDAMSTADHFLNAIRNIQGTSIAGNSFTLRDLARVDQNYGDKIVPITARSANRDQMNALAKRHQRGSTDDWVGADYMTQMAALIANAFPSIMTDCAMQKVVLYSSNMDPHSAGRFHTVVSSAYGFLRNIDLSEFIATIIPRVETELLMSLDMNGEIGVSVEISSELNGDTRVELNIGGQIGTFVTPTFADASYSPVIVGEFSRLNDIAHMFHRVMENVTEQYGGTPHHDDQLGGNTSSFSGHSEARHFADEYSHTDGGHAPSAGSLNDLDSVL